MSIVIWFVDGQRKRKRGGRCCLAASIIIILFVAGAVWIMTGGAEAFLRKATEDTEAPSSGAAPQVNMLGLPGLAKPRRHDDHNVDVEHTPTQDGARDSDDNKKRRDKATESNMPPE